MKFLGSVLCARICLAFGIGMVCIANISNASNVNAGENNPLFGAWKWNVGINDCKSPDFIFRHKKAILNGDADGTPISFKYEKIKYEKRSDSQYLVDFGDSIGLAGTLTESSALVNVISENSIAIQRKPVSDTIKLERCPSKK